VALALAVLHLGGSATQLGLVVAAYSVVDVATTLFAGVLGDRISRTLLMRGSSVVAAVSQAIVAVSLIGGWANLSLLAGMSALNGALAALGGPSSRAVVPQTVDPAALPAAISVLRLSQNTAMLLGFSAAGLLVAVFGPGWAIAIDAATFVVAAFCFTVLKVDPQDRHGDEVHAGRPPLRRGRGLPAHLALGTADPGADLPPDLRRSAGRARADRGHPVRSATRPGAGRWDR